MQSSVTFSTKFTPPTNELCTSAGKFRSIFQHIETSQLTSNVK